MLPQQDQANEFIINEMLQEHEPTPATFTGILYTVYTINGTHCCYVENVCVLNIRIFN